MSDGEEERREDRGKRKERKWRVMRGEVLR